MDQNLNSGRSNRNPEQSRQHRQPQGGGPPPQAQPPHGEMGGGGGQGRPPQQSPPHGGQQPPRQEPGGPPRGTGGGQGRPPQQQPPQGGMHSQRGMQSQQGMGQQHGTQPMPPQQGMQHGQQGMGAPGTSGQRQIPVEPVGAEEVSPEDVVTGSPDDPVTSLLEKMSQADVGTVVITEDRRPVGLVTDRAIAMSLMDQPDVSDVTAEDVMTEDLVTVRQDETMFDAIQTLGSRGIRRAPIVDDEGNLAGIVSMDDAIVLLAEELDQVSEAVEQQIDRF